MTNAYYYVYWICNTKLKKSYVGVRKSKILPHKDLGKNPIVSKYMFALEDWLHQNEVLVKLNKPVKINNSPQCQQP